MHKVIQPDPAVAADESRKRKRKDRKGGGNEPRELTGYNKFMRDQLSSLKETNPTLSHREVFKLATTKVLSPPSCDRVISASLMEG